MLATGTPILWVVMLTDFPCFFFFFQSRTLNYVILDFVSGHNIGSVETCGSRQ